MKKIQLMSHLVAGYPTDETAQKVADALVQGGSDYLEIQLPFSDPSADGAAIQKACTTVLQSGYTTEKGLACIYAIHRKYPTIPIFLMSYASLVYTPGIAVFCKKAKAAGVTGLIIPDLPFDHDEGLTAECNKNGLYNIPVASPSMTDERIKKMLAYRFEYVYATLRSGITGSTTTIERSTIDFLQKFADSNCKLLAGFGITGSEQSEAIAPYVHAVVAGSVFVRIISKNENTMQNLATEIVLKVKKIKGDA